MSFLLDATANSRLTMHEHGDGSGVICQSTDVSGALRRNEELRRAGATKTHDGDHYVASIPLDLLNEWAMKRGTTWEIVGADDKLLDQFLAEHRKCRIYEGRI
jgi:hypothetical protein